MLGARSSRLVICLIHLPGPSHLGSWVFRGVEQSQEGRASQILLEAVTLLADMNTAGSPEEVICEWQPAHI